jgi:hypothetical protein
MSQSFLVQVALSFTKHLTVVIMLVLLIKKGVLNMADNSTEADGYYNEDTNAPKEDFDLSFLDDDEPEK